MITEIPVDAIAVNTSERRALADVSELAASIEKLGLLNPITVAPEEKPDAWRLVAGAHRLAAVRRLGWQKVPANVMTLNGLEAELAMIDENLMRNELTVLDRSDLLPRRKEIHETLWPQTKHGGDRKSGEAAKSSAQNEHLIQSFVQDTATKTGQSRQTVQRQLQIAQRITPDVKDAIRDLPIADSKTELLELARQKPEVQREVAKRLVEATQEQSEKPKAKAKPPDAKQLINEVKKEQKREEIAARPVPEAEVVPARIEVVNATERWPLEDGTVDLIVTSPPYGLDIAYAVGDVEADKWEAFMEAWMREAFRVAGDTGRMCVNIPLDTNLPTYRPTYSQTVNAALRAGWSYRSSIVWEEGNVSRSTARGSVDSHSAINVTCGDEMIGVFYKGEWARADGATSDIPHESWLEWTNGHWRFSGEAKPYDDHPAAFPEELARRLILLFSGQGATVLDPFCGSGTTPTVANRLGRIAVGFDLDSAWVASSRRRVMEEVSREPAFA